MNTVTIVRKNIGSGRKKGQCHWMDEIYSQHSTGGYPCYNQAILNSGLCRRHLHDYQRYLGGLQDLDTDDAAQSPLRRALGKLSGEEIQAVFDWAHGSYVHSSS